MPCYPKINRGTNNLFLSYTIGLCPIEHPTVPTNILRVRVELTRSNPRVAFLSQYISLLTNQSQDRSTITGPILVQREAFMPHLECIPVATSPSIAILQGVKVHLNIKYMQSTQHSGTAVILNMHEGTLRCHSWFVLMGLRMAPNLEKWKRKKCEDQ